MARKVFLSFLGTNDYVPCNYYFEDDESKKVTNVKYVQEALLKFFSKNNLIFDEIIILTTELSNVMNYGDNGQLNYHSKEYNAKNIGLKTRILQQELDSNLRNVEIKEGFSETEIWDVFEKVSDAIRQEDEIYLDITHAFRYLPMLGVILSNFLKVTKNVQIKGVFYGAFEKLGFATEVRKLDLDIRNAPVLNLLPLIELQEWTFSARNFVEHGIVKDVVDLTNLNIQPLLRETAGKDELSNHLRSFGTRIQSLVPLIQTNRGKEITQFNYSSLNECIKHLKEIRISIKPLNELFNIIEKQISQISTSDFVWLESAKWCHKYNLIPQGWTQLQEGLISYLIGKLRVLTKDEFYSDELNIDARSLVSSSLNIISLGIQEADWKFETLDFRNKVKIIIKTEEVNQFSNVFANLTAGRNDVNHGGYNTSSSSARKLKSNLKICIDEAEDLIKNSTLQKEIEIPSPMLLNLSNHPSSKWPSNQMSYAIDFYDAVEDLPFPHIDPSWDTDELDLIVDEYVQKIRKINPEFVHIMGELTFTFRMVQRLEAIGIPCLASTTERKVVVEENKKISEFIFIRFRPY